MNEDETTESFDDEEDEEVKSTIFPPLRPSHRPNENNSNSFNSTHPSPARPHH